MFIYIYRERERDVYVYVYMRIYVYRKRDPTMKSLKRHLLVTFSILMIIR